MHKYFKTREFCKGDFLKNKNKGARHNIVSRVSQSIDIPFDMLTNLPMIKMLSNREIYIEDAGEITKYDDNCVCVVQGKNTVFVEGHNLDLKFLSDGNIRVFGYIERVCFEMNKGREENN